MSRRDSTSNIVGGLNRTLAQERLKRYDKGLEERLRAWLASIFERPAPGLPLDARRTKLLEEIRDPNVSLEDLLKTGEILCHLLNYKSPNLVPKIHISNKGFQQIENIQRYLEKVQTLGMHKQNLFSTVDLFEGKNMLMVLSNLNMLKGIIDGETGDAASTSSLLSTRRTASPAMTSSFSRSSSTSSTTSTDPSPKSTPSPTSNSWSGRADHHRQQQQSPPQQQPPPPPQQQQQGDASEYDDLDEEAMLLSVKGAPKDVFTKRTRRALSVGHMNRPYQLDHQSEVAAAITTTTTTTPSSAPTSAAPATDSPKSAASPTRRTKRSYSSSFKLSPLRTSIEPAELIPEKDTHSYDRASDIQDIEEEVEEEMAASIEKELSRQELMVTTAHSPNTDRRESPVPMTPRSASAMKKSGSFSLERIRNQVIKTQRASVSSLEEDVANKEMFKYDQRLEKKAQKWIEACVGDQFPKDESFADVLMSGVWLCRLVNSIQPGLIPHIHRNNNAYFQMENIQYYRKACLDLGLRQIDLFDTIDLVEQKNINNVITHLHVLGKHIAKRKGYKGPVIEDSKSQRNLYSATLVPQDVSTMFQTLREAEGASDEEDTDVDEETRATRKKEQESLLEWVNEQLGAQIEFPGMKFPPSKYPPPAISSFRWDFRTGVILLRLLEVVTRTPLTFGFYMNPATVLQCEQNGTLLLRELGAQTFCQIDFCTTTDIVNGAVQSVTELVQFMRKKFDIGHMFMSYLDDDNQSGRSQNAESTVVYDEDGLILGVEQVVHHEYDSEYEDDYYYDEDLDMFQPASMDYEEEEVSDQVYQAVELRNSNGDDDEDEELELIYANEEDLEVEEELVQRFTLKNADSPGGVAYASYVEPTSPKESQMFFAEEYDVRVVDLDGEEEAEQEEFFRDNGDAGNNKVPETSNAEKKRSDEATEQELEPFPGFPADSSRPPTSSGAGLLAPPSSSAAGGASGGVVLGPGGRPLLPPEKVKKLLQEAERKAMAEIRDKFKHMSPAERRSAERRVLERAKAAALARAYEAAETPGQPRRLSRLDASMKPKPPSAPTAIGPTPEEDVSNLGKEGSRKGSEEDATQNNNNVPTFEITPALVRQNSSNQLSAEEIKKLRAKTAVRKNIAMEILTTEANYVEFLETLVDNFATPLKDAGFLTNEEVYLVVANVTDILQLHRMFLEHLRIRMGTWKTSTTLGDIFMDHGHFLEPYKLYVSNYGASMLHLAYFIKKHPPLASVVKDFDDFQRKTTRLPLESVIIMPIQRLPRYILLLKELKKYTEQAHPDDAHISKAIQLLEGDLEALNAVMHKTDLEMFRRLQLILSSVEGNIHDIISPHSKLIREGVLTVRNAKQGTSKSGSSNSLLKQLGALRESSSAASSASDDATDSNDAATTATATTTTTTNDAAAAEEATSTTTTTIDAAATEAASLSSSSSSLSSLSLSSSSVSLLSSSSSSPLALRVKSDYACYLFEHAFVMCGFKEKRDGDLMYKLAFSLPLSGVLKVRAKEPSKSMSSFFVEGANDVLVQLRAKSTEDCEGWVRDFHNLLSTL